MAADDLLIKHDRKRQRPSTKKVNEKHDAHLYHQKKKLLRGKEDEEIDSDEEELAHLRKKDIEKSSNKKKLLEEEFISDDEEFFESPEERRVKLAKKFLEQVGMGSKTDAEIAEKLTLEANISGKKVYYTVADKLEIQKSNFFKGHKDCATCVAVSEADPTHVFTGGKDCSILYWDVISGSKTVLSGRRKDFECGGHFEQVTDLSISEDGNTLISVGLDRVVRLWDIRSGNKPIDYLKGHTKSITAVCAEPQSGMKRFFTTGADLSLRVWSLGSRKCLETFYGHTATALCMDIVGNDRPVTGGEDSTVRLWKTSNESHLLYHFHKQPVDAVVQLNPTRTISGSQDGSFCLWSVASRKPLAVVPDAHGGSWITALGCLRYSDVFFSGSDDGYIRLWKTVSSESKKAKHKLATVIELQDKAIPVTGIVSQITTSSNGEYLYATIGKEHKHGRWKHIKNARNGLLVVKLNNSIYDAVPAQCE